MNILVSDGIIIDGGRSYVLYPNRVECGDIRYVTLNNKNSQVYVVDDFDYDQRFDGGRFSYVDGVITELYPRGEE